VKKTDLAHCVERFLGSLREKNASLHTQTAYRKDLAKLVAYARPACDAGTLDHLGIRGFLAQLYSAGLSKSSVARHLAALRSLFRWMAQEGIVESNPALLVATPRLPRKLPRVPTVEEMNTALDSAIPKCSSFPERDALIFELLYGCGIRNAELVAMNLDDISSSNELILIRGKGKKERLVPFGESVCAALKEYLPARQRLLAQKRRAPPSLLLSLRAERLTTRSVGRIVKRIAVAKGLPADVHPHTLRHTLGTNMLQEGADLRTIQEILGHERLSTTQRYTQLSVKHVMDVYDKTHPKA